MSLINGAGLDSAAAEIEARKVGIATGKRHQPSKPSTNCPQVFWSLHYGDARTAVALVVPDDRWPGMFRVWANGALSDLANLTRAKDAAVAICERGPPRRNARLFHWEKHWRERPAKAPPMRLGGRHG